MNWKHRVCIASLCLISFSANAATPMIATSQTNSMYLNADGSVWGTGLVGSYWPGATSPVPLLQLPGVIAVASDGYAFFALLADGTVWASGQNDHQQLADGTSQNRAQAQPISGLSGITAIAASDTFHYLALKNDGTVWAWGSNDWGQLGDGTQAARYVPGQVSGLTNVTRISAGAGTSLALKSDGTVWVWGVNCCGQAGNGVVPANASDPEYNHLIPTRVSNLDRITAIAAGSQHHMALRDDGTVWSWGSGEFGQIGTGKLTGEYLPVQVTGLDAVIAIGANSTQSSFALKSDGTVWAWGSNSLGLLAATGITYGATPVQVPGLSGIAAISAGSGHIVAMRTNGTVLAWGTNAYGELGDGTLQGRIEPRAVTSPGGSGQLDLSQPAPTVFNQLPQAQISLSVASGRAPLDVTASVSNASDPDGTIAAYYWTGGNGQQALGPSATFSFTQAGTYQIDLLIEDNAGARGHAAERIVVAPAVAAPIATAPKVGMGSRGSIALANDGRILTWGERSGYYDFLATLSLSVANSIPVANGIGGAVDVAVNENHFHVLMANGTVQGWGGNTNGAVGSGGTAPGIDQPQLLPNLPLVQALAAGGTHVLALTRDGQVFAWGGNAFGQLGLGDQQNRFQAAEVPGMAAVNSIAAGYRFSVALKADGTVWTWGDNCCGQLGDGTNISRDRPIQVPGLAGIKRIFATGYAMFAQDADGKVWATGNVPVDSPFQTPGPGAWYVPALDNVIQIAGGGRNNLIALKADGTVWTAGWQSSLALGVPTDVDLHVLTQLPGITDAISVASGGLGAMVLRRDGTVLAWGMNDYGQIGDGTLAQRLTPVAVVNESADGFLDLIPGTDFELPPSAGVPFFAVTAGDISGSKATVYTRAKFNGGDVGKSGKVFVTARVPPGSLVAASSPMSAADSLGASVASKAISSAVAGFTNFVLINLTDLGWKEVTNGQLLPYATGVLGEQLSAQTILDNTDTTNLKGAQFCLGYGIDAAQMVATGTMRVVASIPDPNATGAATATCIVAGPPVSYSLALPQGWSLLGNSLNQRLTVASLFNDANAVTSVWKWDAGTLGWQFYTPQMDATALQTYAASKGYSVLAEIKPGEGYWVNAKAQPTLGTQSGDSFILTGINLAKGWNLVATGNDITPTEFNANLKASAVPASVTTLWAWDNPSSKWYFYAPSLEVQGGTALSGYIANKGYLDFTQANKKLGNGTGFWVNR